MKLLALIASALFSFILYLIGLYSVLVYTIANWAHLNTANLGEVALAGAGIVCGVILFVVSTLNWTDSRARYNRHKSLNRNQRTKSGD